MTNNFEIQETEIPNLIKITPFYAEDNRGDFVKDFSSGFFCQTGVNFNIDETMYASNHFGVLRGLHFQREMPQEKLVHCIYGHIWDVVVDLRKESPAYKKWLAFDLTGQNRFELLVPKGCAHGYLVLEEGSIVLYKCMGKYYKEYDSGIVWNDPDIAIDWDLLRIGGADKVIISNKDRCLHSFKAYEEEKNYG